MRAPHTTIRIHTTIHIHTVPHMIHTIATIGGPGFTKAYIPGAALYTAASSISPQRLLVGGRPHLAIAPNSPVTSVPVTSVPVTSVPVTSVPVPSPCCRSSHT